jgi:hypothetical protein
MPTNSGRPWKTRLPAPSVTNSPSSTAGRRPLDGIRPSAPNSLRPRKSTVIAAKSRIWPVTPAPYRAWLMSTSLMFH